MLRTTQGCRKRSVPRRCCSCLHKAESADGVVPEATIRAAIRHYYLRPGQEHPRAGSPVLTTVPVYFHCSRGNFLTILRCLYKLQRDRIQTVAKIGWSRTVIEHMS